MCTLSLDLILKAQCEVLGILKYLLASLEIDFSCPNRRSNDAVGRKMMFWVMRQKETLVQGR